MLLNCRINLKCLYLLFLFHEGTDRDDGGAGGDNLCWPLHLLLPTDHYCRPIYCLRWLLRLLWSLNKTVMIEEEEEFEGPMEMMEGQVVLISTYEEVEGKLSPTSMAGESRELGRDEVR